MLKRKADTLLDVPEKKQYLGPMDHIQYAQNQLHTFRDMLKASQTHIYVAEYIQKCAIQLATSSSELAKPVIYARPLAEKVIHTVETLVQMVGQLDMMSSMMETRVHTEPNLQLAKCMELARQMSATFAEEWNDYRKLEHALTLVYFSNLTPQLQSLEDVPLRFRIHDRYKFAFQNGILYIGDSIRFVEYKHATDSDYANACLQFFPQSMDITKYMCEMHSGCDLSKPCKQKRVDVSTLTCGDVSKIATPSLDKIWNTQRFSPALQLFLLAMWLGRSFYQARTYDQWNVACLAFGKGHGKGVLTQFLIDTFPRDGINISTDPTNLLTPISFLTALPHMQPKRWNSSVLCELIRGEHGCAHHIIMEGTQIPFRHLTSELFKHILPIVFDVAVSSDQQDATLLQALEQERPAIMLKSILAYRQLAKKYGSKDLFKIAPPEMFRFLDQMNNRTIERRREESLREAIQSSASISLAIPKLDF